MAHILVVDDEELIREVIREALEFEGHHVMLAGNGAEALAIARDTIPELVITDVIMPDTEGIELIRNLRRLAAGTPVIVMSGNAVGTRFLEAARVFGACDSLAKPFSLAELSAAVSRALSPGR